MAPIIRFQHHFPPRRLDDTTRIYQWPDFRNDTMTELLPSEERAKHDAEMGRPGRLRIIRMDIHTQAREEERERKRLKMTKEAKHGGGHGGRSRG